MKWFIASDIHGSSYYTNKMLIAYEVEKADRMLLLGDILYHGPRNDLPRDYAPKDTEVDQMVLKFPIMADYAVICEGEKMIFATHGHNYNCDKLPPLHSGDILLHGHTHIPVCENHENFTYINPGSVSIPKENSHHGYMILENGVFTWKDFDGNVVMTYEI